MPSPQTKSCTCGCLESASKEPDHPIRWDERLNEFYISHGNGGRMMVYYCMICGGKTPKSRRSSMFAHVSEAEATRIANLFRGVRTVSDAISKFGPPDDEREISSVIHHPASFGAPERSEVFRGLAYKSLSQVAEIVFEVGTGGLVSGTWIQKYIGSSKT